MESQDNLEEQVIQFVKEWTRRRIPMTTHTLLVDDVGIWGDDGDDFILEFGKKFNVEVYGFPIGKYFGTEGFSIIDSFIDLSRMLKGEPTQQPQLTIADLVNAVKQGKFELN